MFQSLCLALIVAAALTEALGLYQWSRQSDMQGLQQTEVLIVSR
jgi:hypothetical protein